MASKLGSAAVAALVLFASSAAAQQPTPVPAPPAVAPLAPIPPPTSPQAPYAPPYPGYNPGAYPPPYYYAPYPGPMYAAPMYMPSYGPPPELAYVEGRPVPAGYHVETRMRRGLVIAGAVVLGSAYALSLSVAAESAHDGDGWLYAPVVGPFLDLATRSRCETRTLGAGLSYDYCSDDGNRTMLMLDGLTQLTGATLLAVGLLSPQKLLVRDELARKAAPAISWGVAPRTFGPSSLGLGMGGEF